MILPKYEANQPRIKPGYYWQIYMTEADYLGLPEYVKQKIFQVQNDTGYYAYLDDFKEDDLINLGFDFEYAFFAMSTQPAIVSP